MRAAVVVALLPLVALLTAGSCGPPSKPPPNEGEEEGLDECEVDGVTMPKPKNDDNTLAEAILPAGGTIDLSCIDDPPVLDASTTVRVQGCIDVFGLGDRAKRGIKVAIFGNDQNPGTDVPDFGEVEIKLQEDATGLDCVAADKNDPACLALACDRKGAYALEGVPTHVPLTIKVYADDDDTVIDTYTYGITFGYFSGEPVDGDDTALSYEANLIYSSTWDSIPTIAGRLIDGGLEIGDGEGRAVITSEIHDCTDALVQGASVISDKNDLATKVTYFDGDANDPNPALLRLSTNSDGLYVVLNADTTAPNDLHTITAGIVEPGCTGAECLCVSLGSLTVRTFPDSVSIATLRGPFPTTN